MKKETKIFVRSTNSLAICSEKNTIVKYRLKRNKWSQPIPNCLFRFNILPNLIYMNNCKRLTMYPLSRYLCPLHWPHGSGIPTFVHSSGEVVYDCPRSCFSGRRSFGLSRTASSAKVPWQHTYNHSTYTNFPTSTYPVQLRRSCFFI
jgi:hypothetical protein